MSLDFFNLVCDLKKIPRQGWIDKLGIEKPESVSDHTFSMSILGWIFSEIEKLDTLKVLKMILIHDLSESITGDLTPEKISKQDKAALENNTMNIIFEKIPENIRDEFVSVWDEFRENQTNEAILVHEIDKLEMALQAKLYQKEKGYDVETFLKSAKNEIKNPNLQELFRKINEEK